MSVKALIEQQTEALKTPVDNGRRLRLYTVSLDQLHEALMGRLTLTGVPEDAMLCDISYDFFSESVVLKYSHPSFQPIECGFRIAFFDPAVSSVDEQADLMNAEFLGTLSRKLDRVLSDMESDKVESVCQHGEPYSKGCSECAMQAIDNAKPRS